MFVGFYSQILRASITKTLGEDYVRTARAKGLSERRVLLKHVLRASVVPVVTLWGLDFAAVVRRRRDPDRERRSICTASASTRPMPWRRWIFHRSSR